MNQLRRLLSGLWFVLLLYTLGLWLGLAFQYLRFAGRIQIRHSHRLPRRPKGGLIIVANHPSVLEPMVLPLIFFPHCLWRWRLVPWSTPTSDLRRLLGWLWPRLVFVSRDGNREDETVAFRHLQQILERRGALILFPEGGRTGLGGEHHLSATGKKLRPLKRGVELLARKTGVAVVPIWVAGAETIMPNHPERLFSGWPRFRKKPFVIRVGEPCRFLSKAPSGGVVSALRRRLFHLADESE